MGCSSLRLVVPRHQAAAQSPEIFAPPHLLRRPRPTITHHGAKCAPLQPGVQRRKAGRRQRRVGRARRDRQHTQGHQRPAALLIGEGANTQTV